MSENNRLVSVVVPIYNGASYIDKCVTNLLNQTYKNLEIIMINDGSSDNSLELLKGYCAKYPNINVITKDNSGVSSTRNLGIKMAKGDYIYFYDVDDDIEPTTIADNMALIGDKDVDILYFGFWYHILSENRIKETNIKSAFEGNGHEFFNNAFTDLMQNEVLNSPWNKLYNRNFLIWNKINFDENLSIYEDILFNIKALDRANYLMVNPKPYYHYMIQASGTALTRFHENNYESVKKIHMAGINYAKHYKDNAEVIAHYDNMFIDQTASFLKQLVNKKDIDNASRDKLMEEIIDDDYFIAIINSVENLNKRKVFLKTFSNHHMKGLLKLMYKVTNKQGKEGESLLFSCFCACNSTITPIKSLKL